MSSLLELYRIHALGDGHGLSLTHEDTPSTDPPTPVTAAKWPGLPKKVSSTPDERVFVGRITQQKLLDYERPGYKDFFGSVGRK